MTLQDEIKKWKEADERAENLLISSLSKEEREEYLSTGKITIEGSLGGKYRLAWETNELSLAAYIERLDKPLLICYKPTGIPYCDKILSQKLIIETREDLLLENCNCWSMAGIPRKEWWSMRYWRYIGNGYGERKRDTA